MLNRMFLVVVVAILFVAFGGSAFGQNLPRPADKDRVEATFTKSDGSSVTISGEGPNGSKYAKELIDREGLRQMIIEEKRMEKELEEKRIEAMKARTSVIVVPAPVYVDVAPVSYPDLPRAVVVKRWIAHPVYRYAFWSGNGYYFWSTYRGWVYTPTYQIVYR